MYLLIIFRTGYTEIFFLILKLEADLLYSTNILRFKNPYLYINKETVAEINSHHQKVPQYQAK